MPWKVVYEILNLGINKVLKTDGIVMIFTHHAFPLHDLPWDYWRFSDNAWHGLFNNQTGFEVIETSLIDPVTIISKSMYAGTIGLETAEAFIHSAVIARKVSETDLSWNVSVPEIIKSVYPE